MAGTRSGRQWWTFACAAVAAAVVWAGSPAAASAALIRIDSFAGAPAQISPANADGLFDESAASLTFSTPCADVSVPATGGPSRYVVAANADPECKSLVQTVLRRSNLEARWLIDVVPVLDPTAPPLRTFDRAVSLATGPMPGGLAPLFDPHVVALEWDGRDETGALVPGGVYLLVASVDLVELPRTLGGEGTLATAGTATVPVEVDNTPPDVSIVAPAAGAVLGSLEVLS